MTVLRTAIWGGPEGRRTAGVGASIRSTVQIRGGRLRAVQGVIFLVIVLVLNFGNLGRHIQRFFGPEVPSSYVERNLGGNGDGSLGNLPRRNGPIEGIAH